MIVAQEIIKQNLMLNCRQHQAVCLKLVYNADDVLQNFKCVGRVDFIVAVNITGLAAYGNVLYHLAKGYNLKIKNIKD